MTKHQKAVYCLGVKVFNVLPPYIINDINDLAVILRKHATPILFADDISIIITSPDSTEFKTKINQVTNDIASWCTANFLTLNLEKTNSCNLLSNIKNKWTLM